MANKKTTRKVTYSEPSSYYPKEIRDKYFGNEKKKPTTKKKGK